jgi:hypothetical protein
MQTLQTMDNQLIGVFFDSYGFGSDMKDCDKELPQMIQVCGSDWLRCSAMNDIKPEEVPF